MFNAEREAEAEAAEREMDFWDAYMPDWEARLAENDFFNAYDVMDELRELGMVA